MNRHGWYLTYVRIPRGMDFLRSSTSDLTVEAIHDRGIAREQSERRMDATWGEGQRSRVGCMYVVLDLHLHVGQIKASESGPSFGQLTIQSVRVQCLSSEVGGVSQGDCQLECADPVTHGQ